MIGTVILKYRIETLLGSSLLGDIYTGIHIETKVKVIIRCINFQSTANIEVKLRLKNDLCLLSQINHPGIAKIYDHSESGSNLFIISEFIEGKSLIKYREEYKNFFAHIIQEGFYSGLLGIFSLVHSKGIVHGHIKPSNILITSDDKIKVINFGLSDFSEIKTEYSNKKNNNNLAAIIYSSPEQLQKKSIDQKSDIYSLGVLLFFLLTGKNPYQTISDDDELIKMIISEPFPLDVKNTEGLPEKYIAIIKKATEKNTENRFQNCEQFKAAFNFPAQPTTVEKKTEVKPVTPVIVDKPKPVSVHSETPVAPHKTMPVQTGSTFNKSQYGQKNVSAAKGLSIGLGVVVAVVLVTFLSVFINSEKKTDTDNNYTEQEYQENMLDSMLNQQEHLLDSINKSIDTTISDSVYVKADQMPEFPGGKDSFTKWLKNNVHYPQKAKQANIKGDVTVSFVIDEKGKPTDVKVVKDIGGGCGEEAEKLIDRMPGWKPGKQNGRNVKVRFEVPVIFGPEQ
ncbi:MAG: TonB family protein [Bacteroidota bacterium]